MTDLHYDYSKAKEAGEKAGFAWSDDMARLADARLRRMGLTQAQVDELLGIYTDALVFFTTGTMPDAG